MRASDTSATHTSPRAAAGAIFVSHGPRPLVAAACSAAAPRREGESGHATLTRRRAAAIGVVRLHDRLHELVTDDVALIEVDERDAVDFADHLHRLHQPRGAAKREIDLRHVTGDDRLRSEAEAGEEHLHLFGRGVLRLVQDHERVVERAAAHERERRHFDRAAFEILLGLLDVEHVVERVVQRAQVGVHFLLQIAGQEAKLLAGFDGGPREDDAAHLLREQVAHRLRHRKIRLAGAGRADPEHDVVLVDGFEIAPLVGGFRRNAALAGRPQLAIFQEVIAEVDIGVFGDQLRGGLHVAIGNGMTFADQAAKLFHEPRHARGAVRIALDHQIVALRTDADVEEGFELAEVIVEGAEERRDAGFRNRNLPHRGGADSCISLRYKQLTATATLASCRRSDQGRHFGTRHLGSSAGQALGQLRRREFGAPMRILTGPQRREVAAALRFGLGAQRRDRRGGQRKRAAPRR